MTYDQIIINRYKEFLIHGMTKEQALYCSRLMFELTNYGFVRYISQYFYKIKGYKTEAIDGRGDGGFDIIGKSIFDKIKYVIVQCKKWFYDYIRPGEILTFKSNFEKQKEKYKEHKLYFVTTERVNKEAREEAKGCIEIIDCRKLLKLKEEYSLDEFAKDFKKDEYKKRFYKKNFFTKKNVKLIIDTNEDDVNNKSSKRITKYSFIDNNRFHKNHYIKAKISNI